MSRRKRSASKAFAASSLGLLGMLLGLSGGCEFATRVDRGEIPSGIGGSGNAGGSGVECTTASDCPGMDTVCRTRTCDAGKCGFLDAAAGTATGNDTKGDCLREICDGAGAITTEPDDADILDDGKECTTDICAGGKPLNQPKGAGAKCTSNGGKVCDGAVDCVECTGPEHCASSVCTANKCVPAACADKVKNGTETDVDCGGADCAGCADGLACKVAADCENKVCTLKVCQVASCTDTVLNGDETDVDCGGSCTPCNPGKSCTKDSDCIGGSCSGSVCLETCTDNILNGNETDIDCGGPTCNPCVTGETCSINTDCESKICNNAVCQGSACTDGTQNGGETGVDCGGSCTPCADGIGCNVSTDCASGVCTAMVCQVATCSDMTKNGDETDVDCGGGTCSGCDLGKMCNQNSDCGSNICVSGICVNALCGDGLVTGAETCDDGNATSNDGCSSMCTDEAGFTCNGGSPTICTPICNDGMVVAGEDCDDGNGTNGDGCSATCMVELGYACGGSPSVCTSHCGDGVILAPETCDDGNSFGGDGCSTKCTIEPGFNCVGEPTMCSAICGDGVIVGFEECDDGNANAGDGCSATCSVETNYGCSGVPSVCYAVELEPNSICTGATGPFTPPFLLNGRIKPVGDLDFIRINVPAYADLRLETFVPAVGQCTADPDLTLYAADCTTQIIYDDLDGLNFCALIDPNVDAVTRNIAPGTYFIKVNEYNNDATIDAYQLQVTFTALCGNGVKEGSETCDDGNTATGDGCSNRCRIEPRAEVEPNNVCGQASGPYPASVVYGGAITPVGDQDLYAFTLPAYADVKIQTFSGPNNVCATGIDTVVQLRASDCNTILTTNDNGGVGTCSLIDSATNPAAANLAPGTYYVRVEENGNNATIAGYELHILLNSLCGDGVVQGSEKCDDGNTTAGDGCSDRCRLEQGWTCSGTPTTCTFNCGDGTITGTEVCDDGNTNSGDGCTNVCLTEPGYYCTGLPSACTFTCGNGIIDGNDQCDDGNLTAGDGCSPTCNVELSYRCTGTPSVCTRFESLCNDGLDGDNDGLIDSADTDCQIPAYFPACTAGQQLRVFKATDVPKAIPDSNTTGVTSTLIIGQGAGTITRAAVLYNINHTWDSDLDLTLIPPNGTNMDICSGNGSSGDNYTNTVLDSTCATSVTGGVAPFSGCYQPETSFASLGGSQASGVWKFKSVDHAGGDTGTLTAWAMIFCATP